uniref:Uncharacterized protein n=1 Tax=Anguilla anguilla TaxID=7936 RepID=A0A0E9WAD2_ANGAN
MQSLISLSYMIKLVAYSLAGPKHRVTFPA